MYSILLVEDNPDDEALTLRALRKAGITSRVTVARDGCEAMGILLNRPGEAGAFPRLVLLDLKLPKLDGLEVLRAIRADRRTQFIPVVMLTSSRESEDVLASYQNGANAYVRKPLKFADFTQAVQTLSAFWLQLNEVVRDEPPLPA
jgi:CheY-like chemotaxis protein